MYKRQYYNVGLPDYERLSTGVTLPSLKSIFDIPNDAEWDQMLADRQAMCEVDLSGTVWDQLQLAYESRYENTPRFAEYFNRKPTWATSPDCYPYEMDKDPRACAATSQLD